ncbi:sensor histidine kinase, partial [Streptomyces sp. NPDC058953]|uniref:sensor histidine kinase n=1 Tax=Streptomyces sp. NPDC058953 TaxID=3346676 RepID=UPI003687DBE1
SGRELVAGGPTAGPPVGGGCGIGIAVPARWAGGVSAIGLGVVFLAAVVVQADALGRTWGAAYWVPGTATAVPVCALALLRHRDRTRTAIAALLVAALGVLVTALPGTGLPAALGPPVALGLGVLVGSAVRSLPPARAAAVAGAGLLLAAAQFAVRPTSVVGPVAAAILLAAAGAGLSLRRLDGRAVAAADEVRRAERLELARELHDVVAHHITGMLIQAQAAHVVARRDPEGVPASLAGIEAAGIEAMAAMRRVVGLLRDDGDAAPVSPGPETLGALVERFGREGPPVRLRGPGDDTGWPPEVTSTVYRVVREALTNVRRHARHARSVDVTVGRAADTVTVEVTDDARADSARPHQRGYGLIGMRERVEKLGGRLTAGPRPGGGWSVRATLPVPTREPG